MRTVFLIKFWKKIAISYIFRPLMQDLRVFFIWMYFLIFFDKIFNLLIILKKIIQGNFSDSDVKWTSNDIRHMKLRVSVQYHQGKERFSEQSSRTSNLEKKNGLERKKILVFSTLNPIWNDLLVIELDSHNQSSIKLFFLKKSSNV